MVGCFPWPRRRGASEAKDRMEVDVVDVGLLLDGENQTIPTTAMYSITGGRALAEAIEGVADLVPLPFLSTFVRMSIKVLEACEETTAIEENLKDLQSRVYNLMLVVVDTVPVNQKTSLDLQDKISKLQAILDNILADVRKIKEQRKWLLFFFRDLNKERVGRCVNRLDDALQQFNARFLLVASQLRVEDLLDKIKADHSAFAAQLNRIEEAVNRTTQPHNAPSASPMPSLKGKLYGRESLVQEIANLLASENTSRVCITGAGGMGKTSVALAVADSPTIKNVFPEEFIFWVPCVKAASSDLLRRLLYTQLRVTAKAYDSLDTLILELNATKQRRLILLDNFQTPWLSGEFENRAEVKDILLHLAELSHIALLVTMTSGFPPGGIEWEHRPLSPLDSAAASAAFKSKYDEQAGKDAAIEEGPELDKFLTSIGRMPLAIELTATTGGRLRTSSSDLLRNWDRSGMRMMSGTEHSMDHTIRLSLDNSSAKDNPEALELLAIISLLPAGTIGNNLDRWAATLDSPIAALHALRVAALIEQGDGAFGTARIFVHPTIQSYMLLHHLSPEIRNTVFDACYSFVLDHKSTPDDRKFKMDIEALRDEEMNIQGLLMETDVVIPRPKAIDALIAFALYQAFTKPSIVVASHALRVVQAVHDDGFVDREVAHHLAEAYYCLGKNYYGLDKFEKACEHYEAARSRFMELPGGADFTRSGECSLELWYTWTFRDRDETQNEAMKSVAEEARTNLAQDTNNKYSIARGLLADGRHLWWVQSPDEVILSPLKSAIAIFEELECPASCAECLYILARTCIRSRKYDMALTFAREGVEKAEQSGVAELLSRTLWAVALCLVNLERYEEALDIFARTILLEQASGASLGLAQNLECLGYTCVLTCDLTGARRAYDAALFHFSKTQRGTRGDQDVNRCSRNLEKLRGLTAIDEDCIRTIEEPYPWY
ncbi:hypothetical protein R3P38DRAFT_2960592 [Favolaschia claudopus]|uniref:NB-ARC domain-containing protein n=1 Tax=Favolaschia claudopus TaxID=2862362 RepID=A0AAW0B8H0_9AGAR